MHTQQMDIDAISRASVHMWQNGEVNEQREWMIAWLDHVTFWVCVYAD